ncbi:MAG: hypothetical protein LUG21_03785 [Clostridiales bacterium]|nr:hypothetical protein [Clostridiales bacterium]
MNLYFGKKAKEKAYLESIENNGIFENNFKSAFGQTKIAELVRNHLNSSGSKIKKALIYGFDGARADSMIYLIPSKNKEVTGYNFETQFSAVTQLKNQGGLYLSYAGGDLKNPETLQETSTAQGWASVLTGQWGIENGVVKHVTKKDSSPTVLMEAAQKGLSSVFAAIWPDHFDITYKSEIQTAEKIICLLNLFRLKMKMSFKVLFLIPLMRARM